MNKEVSEERTPRTVEDVKEMLTKHSNGEIQRTIQNCITILQNDHVLADAIRLNLLREISNATQNTSVTTIKMECSGSTLGRKILTNRNAPPMVDAMPNNLRKCFFSSSLLQPVPVPL